MLTRTTFATASVAAMATVAIAVGTATVPAQAAPTASVAAVRAAEPQHLKAELIKSYPAFDANQGVAVDRSYFYAVDNTSITKHRRSTGEPLLQVAGASGGPLIHMDSGAVVGGKLYAAHSNYSQSPMKSSIEVFDTRTMKHVDSYGFGIDRGSLTWLTRHDGAWWAGFANYDQKVDGQVYGGTDHTQIVKLDDRFRVLEAYTLPKVLLDKMAPMSNSGGSWGPDGRLWLTGHDNAEAYVVELPKAGTDLVPVATVAMPDIAGQGIAWDLDSKKPTLWGIERATKEVKQYAVDYRSITSPKTTNWDVVGPGSFR